MKEAGILAIGFFIGYFTLAAVMHLEERKKNVRDE
jgi:hypothetical protein